jgi:hypothetical protein
MLTSIPLLLYDILSSYAQFHSNSIVLVALVASTAILLLFGPP